MSMKNYLFEISWEVCNKVGGIHTVISSKVPTISKEFKNYFLIGPYTNSSNNKNSEFVETKIPKEFEQNYTELLNIGIKIHYGYWNLKERPKVILIEYLDYSKNINDIKSILWEKYKIDSLGSNWYDFDEAILWSWCCGIVIESISNNFESLEDKILVHSHEWMSGGAIFYLKQSKKSYKFKTVFTTHATMLGRSISGSNLDLYKNLKKLDATKLSYELNVHTKHQTEKSLAMFSDCFTTVSKITNLEAKYLYSKEADIILPNGFNNLTNKSQQEIDNEFLKSRKNIDEFLKGYSYDFMKCDVENSKVFYTSGRNEFKNKGVDLYIDSLGKLNSKLKEENSKQNIYNLFLIPIGNFQKDDTVENSINNFKNKDSSNRFVNKILPFSTHNIDSQNIIIKSFLENGLLNRSEDNIKVILIPVYLDSKDGFLNKQYYEIINGTDLSIFPSAYEPWGYTPMESISYSVPTITSNLAGFGRWCQTDLTRHFGVYVLDLENLDFNGVSNKLFEILDNYSTKSKEEISIMRKQSKELANNFTWDKFIINYLNAYSFALKK